MIDTDVQTIEEALVAGLGFRLTKNEARAAVAALRRLQADLAGVRFSEREWRDKAQDKIAEVEKLEVAYEEAWAAIDVLRLEVRSMLTTLEGGDA